MVGGIIAHAAIASAARCFSPADFGGLYGFLMTFQSTIRKSRLLMGILVGIYEVFAGFFWLVILLALFSIGVAIVIPPLLIVMANHKIVYVKEID